MPRNTCKNERGFSTTGKYLQLIQPHMILYYIHVHGMYKRLVAEKLGVPEYELNRQTKDFIFPSGNTKNNSTTRAKRRSEIMSKHYMEDFKHRISISVDVISRPWVKTVPVHCSVYGA